MTIYVKKLRADAIIPEYQSMYASGFDLHACGSYYIYNDSVTMVHSGLSFEFPWNYEMQIRMRSGLAKKYPGYLANGLGTIDSDYRGEIIFPIINPWNPGHPDYRWRIEHGDRIAQAVLVPVIRSVIVEVTNLSETERGDGGFGSTGI